MGDVLMYFHQKQNRADFSRQGANAALAGKHYRDNPYVRGTMEHFAWSDGHNSHRVMVACHRDEYPALFERSHPTKPAEEVEQAMKNETHTYAFTVVIASGKAHTTTAEGYLAESIMDRLLSDAKKDPRTMFAMVHDGGGVRQSYVAPEVKR